MASIANETAIRPEKINFKHDQLGEIVGWTRGTDIVQFRGLPFASIPGRFRQSVLSKALPSQPFMATNPGPTCPQPSQRFFPYWDAPLPDSLPVLERPTEEEFSCLNLSLTIPKVSIDNPSRKTPVLVFIHGGGFVGGSSAIQLSGREVFDGTGLVHDSIQLAKDIIVVTINYRVGPLGFLTSRQLVEYNKRHGEDVGNYGLHDQRRALEWLSEFISGFGGDPDNITIQGTSAGAASCHYQCIFPARKFKRAILASGTYTGIGALSVSRHQLSFDKLSDIVAPGVPADQVLEKILSCDTRDLTHSITWDVCHPVIEGSYIVGGVLQGAVYDENLPDTMVGATEFEEDLAGSIMMDLSTGKPKSDGEILERLWSVISATHALVSPESFPFDNAMALESYNLNDSVKNPSRNVPAWGHLLGNVLFDLPAIYTAIAAQKSQGGGRVWLYRYGITNTYAGNHSYRKAHHGVNDLLLFDVAPELIPLEDQASWNAGVQQTRRSWIEFVNGESPWAPVRRDSSAEATGAIGPVFAFADYGKSGQYDKLEDCAGPELTRQYHSLLSASRLSKGLDPVGDTANC